MINESGMDFDLNNEFFKPVGKLLLAYYQPLCWVIDSSLNIVKMNTGKYESLSCTERMSVEQFFQVNGIDNPIVFIDFKKKIIQLKERIHYASAKQSYYFSCRAEFESEDQLIILAVDVTDQVQQEKDQLKLSFLQNIIDHIPYTLCWKDTDSVFLGCNQLCADLANLSSPEEIVGKTDYDLSCGNWEDSEKYRLDDKRVMDLGQAELNIEERMIIDGTEAVLLTSKVPLFKNGEVIGLICIFLDITERKKMEMELAKTKMVAENALQAKSNLLAMVSHELRTPLHGIMGMTKMIQHASKDQGVLNYNKDIHQLAKTLLQLVNDLLDFTQIEKGYFVLNQTLFSIRQIFNELMTHMIDFYPDKAGVVFESVVDPALPHYLMMDSLRLRQVLSNLLSNAYKFTENGVILFSATLVNDWDDRVQVRFSVKDDGCGIPEKDHEIIFQNFKQASRRQKATDGVGLGLVICQQIVNMMGGHVYLDSQEGRGSCFYFDLMLSKQKENHVVSSTEPVHDGNEYFSFNSHVLLIEDNAVNQKVMSYYLDLLTCSHDVAATGEEAMSYLSSDTQYDFIFLDIGLPDITGLDLSKKIRALKACQKTTVIILSAQVLNNEESNELMRFCDAALVKPADIHTIETTMRQF